MRRREREARPSPMLGVKGLWMKPNILVLDDEPEIASLIAHGLAEDGYNVLTAHSEADFRKMLESQVVDMFILDLNLPDGSGMGLVKDLRRVSDVGIIILTGRSGETDQVIGLEVGADDYITKPFRRRELLARVNSVFRRTRGKQYIPPQAPAWSDATHAAGSDGIPFDGYILNTQRRQLLGPDGREIELTASEFDLLQALLERRGTVLSRDQIMKAIKGRDWETYDRAVDSMISRLRKKISAPSGQSHYIRTVYGIGYTFRG